MAQIPDLIIYFAKGPKEKDRISFIRIKAETFIAEGHINMMKIYELKPDHSIGLAKAGQDSGGYITARINLFQTRPP